MVSQKGVQDEDQRNQVQSGVQVPGGAGGPEGRGERGRGPSGPDLGGTSGYVGQMGEANGGLSYLVHYPSPITRNPSRILLTTGRLWSILQVWGLSPKR